MQGERIRQHAYYRCVARTLAPGSPNLADHPKTVNVREDHVIGPLNDWIGSLFTPEHRDETAAILLASQDPSSKAQSQRQRIRKRLTDADTRLRRHQAAIEAGVNPAALVDVINEAEAARAAAQSELDHLTEPEILTDAAIWAMIDSLGDVATALDTARPERLSTLYESLHLELRYKPHEQAVLVTATPRVGNECVRGGTPTRPCGTPAQCRYPCEKATRPGVPVPVDQRVRRVSSVRICCMVSAGLYARPRRAAACVALPLSVARAPP